MLKTYIYSAVKRGEPNTDAYRVFYAMNQNMESPIRIEYAKERAKELGLEPDTVCMDGIQALEGGRKIIENLLQAIACNHFASWNEQTPEPREKFSGMVWGIVGCLDELGFCIDEFEVEDFTVNTLIIEEIQLVKDCRLDYAAAAQLLSQA